MKHSRRIQKRSYVPQQSPEKYCTGHATLRFIFTHRHKAAAIITLSSVHVHIFRTENPRNGHGVLSVSAHSPNMVNSLAGDRCSSGRCISHRMSHSARSVDRCAWNIICSVVIFPGLAGSRRPQEIARRCHSRIGSRTSQQLD